MQYLLGIKSRRKRSDLLLAVGFQINFNTSKNTCKSKHESVYLLVKYHVVINHDICVRHLYVLKVNVNVC